MGMIRHHEKMRIEYAFLTITVTAITKRLGVTLTGGSSTSVFNPTISVQRVAFERPRGKG